MNMRKLMMAGVACLLAVATYAQPGPKRSPEERAARKAQRRAQLDAMSPAERQAFRKTHREQREAFSC
jgi:hypothetical protein